MQVWHQMTNCLGKLMLNHIFTRVILVYTMQHHRWR